MILPGNVPRRKVHRMWRCLRSQSGFTELIPYCMNLFRDAREF